MDPFGHLSPWLFADMIQEQDIHIRPTIAITKAHMKLTEIEQSVRTGRLVPDGKICLNATGELAVTKFAVEPVWYLAGVAERFGIGMNTPTQISDLSRLSNSEVLLKCRQMRVRYGDHFSKTLAAPSLSLLHEATLSFSFLP